MYEFIIIVILCHLYYCGSRCMALFSAADIMLQYYRIHITLLKCLYYFNYCWMFYITVPIYREPHVLNYGSNLMLC